jgi:hypothetical protein
MSQIRTNPARRLHALLVKALSGECQNKTTAVAISNLFGVPENDALGIYRSFSKLLQLVADTEKCVALIPGGLATAYAHCFPPIYQTLGLIQFNGNWAFNPNTVRSQEIALLQLAGEALNDIVPENVIEATELETLSAEFLELRNDIGNAEISIKLKALLLQELSRIIDSIGDYKVGGAAGIKEATASAYGRIMVDKEILFPEMENPWVTKFYTAVGRAADVSSVALLANQLGWKAAEILQLVLSHQ